MALVKLSARGILGLNLVVYALLHQKLKGNAVGIPATRCRAVALGDLALIAAVDIDLDVAIEVVASPKEHLAVDTRRVVGPGDSILSLNGQREEGCHQQKK